MWNLGLPGTSTVTFTMTLCDFTARCICALQKTFAMISAFLNVGVYDAIVCHTASTYVCCPAQPWTWGRAQLHPAWVKASAGCWCCKGTNQAPLRWAEWGSPCCWSSPDDAAVRPAGGLGGAAVGVQGAEVWAGMRSGTRELYTVIQKKTLTF